MKRIFVTALLGAMLMCGSAFAATDTQQDQNAGFLDFDTTVFTVAVGSSVYVLGEAPASSTTWLAAHPNSTYCVLPRSCKGFVMNATGSNVIIGHPNDVASGAYPVGYPVTAGTPFQWASRNPNQKTLQFKVINNGAATAYVTFAGWGE